MFSSIDPRHQLLHASRGFRIPQGLFHLWVIYWYYSIHSIVGHRTCSMFATPGVSGTSLWWCWDSINLSSLLKVLWTYTHYRQLRPSTNFHPCGQYILHSSHVVDNAREDPFPLPRIFLPKDVLLGQLATWTYQIPPSGTCSSCTPEESDYLQRPDGMSPLCIVHSTLRKIQSKTSMRCPTSNTVYTLQTRYLNHCHPLCRGRQYTPALALRWAIGTQRSVLLWDQPTNNPYYPSRPVKSTNISSVGSRRYAWILTMTTCWREQTPHCVSEASKMGMALTSPCLGFQQIRLSGSGNYTLLRIWDGMTITNTLSNTVVETSSKALDAWCGCLPTRIISCTPISIASTEIHHHNAIIQKFTISTGGGRLQYGDTLEDNHVLIEM